MGISKSDGALARRMRDFYRQSTGYKAGLARHDRAYYGFYASFVTRFTRPGDTVLDLGCGTGLSTFSLRERGLNALGLDVSALFLQDGQGKPNHGAQPFVSGDILHLPARDHSVDAVASHNVIEHLPDVEQAIAEMVRVTRKGGKILILSPNLCSPAWPIKDLPAMLSPTWQGRPPWYFSRSEAFRWGAKMLAVTLQKTLSPHPNCLYREPSLKGAADCGDGDSVYLASPVDFKRIFSQRGMKILKLSSGGTRKGRLLGHLLPYLNTVIAVAVEV